MKKIKVKISDLFKAIEELENVEFQYNKEYSQKSKINITNHTGEYVPVKFLIKKQDKISKIKFNNNKELSVGQNHNFIINHSSNIDSQSNCIKAKDITKNDMLLNIYSSWQTVKEVRNSNNIEDVYDLTVNHELPWYSCANGIVHHNTLIMAMLCKAYSKSKILIIVQSIDLIMQIYNDFLSYGLTKNDMGIIQAQNFDDSKRITLLSAASYEKAFHLFRNINVILFEEVHSVGVTDTGEKISYSCQNAPIHIGMSGTPDRLENPFQQMRLFANIGPIVYERKVATQIEIGAVSKAEIKMIKLRQKPVQIVGHWADSYDYQEVTSEKHKDKLIKDGFEIFTDNGIQKGKRFLEYGDESNHYVFNEQRNKVVVELASKLKRVLIIFNRIQHGKILFDLMNELLPNRAMLVSGDNNVKERKDAINYLESNEDAIVIASNVFSVGINIKAIENVILTGAGKSAIQTIQRVGRGLRLSEKTGKTKATIYDFYDETLSKIAMKQSDRRKRIYESLDIPFKIIEV